MAERDGSEKLGAVLRAKMAERRAMLVPGAGNALSARVIEDLGFEAVYVSGAGVTNMYLGIPDLAFISLPELADHTTAIRDAVSLPIIVDGDTGFGNALNVRHTVRRLERAGANAIQLEDQVMPKKCGHFTGKAVIPMAEMVGKVKAAVDARQDEDFLVVARTDARAVEGFDAAIERAARYVEAGADILFVEAPESLEEVRRIPQLLSAPQMINIVVGGKTPVLDQSELAAMGYGLTLYANAALQGAILGMQRALGSLKTHGRLDETPELLAPFQERQRLVNKPLFDALDRRYASDS
jgi:2-methylisocitrate lyase-like PEP mutase family enzyme